MKDSDTFTEWESERWAKFQCELKEIYHKNSFQKTRFPELANAESWAGFNDFEKACPLTTKKELEADRLTNCPYGSNFTYPLEDYPRFSRTSGTLGQSMIWMDRETDWQWMLGNWQKIFSHIGIGERARCFFAFSFGPFLGFWTAYEAATKQKCICIPSGGQSTEARIRAILDLGVEYLFCTPTYGLRLMDTARTKQIPLQKNSLKKIIVAGECGGSNAGIRQAVDEQWHGKSLFYDHYGMTEVGPVAYEIPGGGGLRILLDSYHAEVIDTECMSPLEDGQTGELILTPLGRIGTPVLRYRTGDLVRVSRGIDDQGKPTFDLVGGILGRADEMVVIRGVNLYPSAIDAIVRKFPEISEYQVLINEARGMKEVVIRAECDEPIAMLLEESFHRAFSLRISVECSPKDTLPRFEMKANRWIKKEKF